MKRIGNQVAMLSMLVFVGGVVSTGQVQAAQGRRQKGALEELLDAELKRRSSLETIIGKLATLAQETHQAGNIPETDRIEDVMRILNDVRNGIGMMNSPMMVQMDPGLVETVTKTINDGMAKAQRNGQFELAKVIKKARDGKLKKEELGPAFVVPGKRR
jgi:hypothetical protein